MNTFTLHLLDATHSETVPGITSFVAEDTTGSFGLLPGHARFMTCLTMGLARFRTEDQLWHYLALPGAVLYFNNNELVLSTRHYLRDDDYTRVNSALKDQLLAEENALQAMKESLHRMEEETLKRLWSLRRTDGG
ncbi:F0F1 ATP synthase subunit epsilon [Marinobacter zhejiangensis]|uniref:ATP synthase epsilon chain n=1 Tax=Marinobacter zhejiangensis TaxID=488535 RepID=A0A1I4TFC3_9GAMM|nr:F0F1 ATP synthase subunit epsilon [Marinobacter zhejiangensis]SFM75389.1 F-type H+-transporting ATPase subunit epsilon [Marinobacter zhejiangensis]